MGSLLNYRTRSVSVNDCKCVLQGSVPGPLLFIAYITDLARIVRHSELFLYADDCKILFACPRHVANPAEIAK